MSNCLVLISDRPEDLTFASRIAELNQLELKQVNDSIQAIALFKKENLGAVFVDISDQKDFKSFEGALESSIGLYSGKLDSNHIHYLCEEDIQDLKYLFQSPIFGNFIYRNFSKDIEDSAQRYSRVVAASLKSRAFGIKDFLKEERSKVQTINFKNTSQKQNGVEAVKNYLITGKFKTRMATVIANAVDELIMNAMFDAPMDALGKSIYQTTPRNTKLDIDPSKPVELHVGFDGNWTAIGAVDHFGSLDKNKLFNHISKNYINEEYKVKTTSAGAGIGLANVYRSGGSFLFISEKGAKTEVIVFFKRTNNYKEFKEQFRFISTQFYF